MSAFTHEELAPTVNDGKTVYRILDWRGREWEVTLRERTGEDYFLPDPTDYYIVNWVSVDKETGQIRQCKGILRPVHIKDILGKVEV